jgi:glycosyltransferase involved in cell wall biosynthesis
MIVSKKKILLISPSSGRGGAENILLEMIDVLSNRFDIYLLTHRGENHFLTNNQKVKRIYITKLFNGALELNIDLLNLLMFPFGFIKNFFLTCYIIKKENIDLVVGNSSTIIYPGLAAKICGKKMFLIFHEMIENNFLRNVFFRISAVCCDRLIFNSKFLLAKFPRSEKAEVIMIGLHKDKFDKLSAIKRKQKKFLTIGQIGKIYKIKGTDFVVQIAKMVSFEDGINFKIYGDILDRQFHVNIRNLINDEKLSGIIEFKTHKDIELILQEVDIVLVTSRFETFGMVAMESMAAGIPVISFNVGAVTEIIENRKNGFIVDKYDINKMAKIILDIKKGKIDIDQLKKNARSTIKDKFIGSFAEKLANTLTR